jgi:phosphotriesterase-related protein
MVASEPGPEALRPSTLEGTMAEPNARKSAEPAAMTVLGPVPVSQLGIALPHEHLLIELPSFIEFTDPALKQRQQQPVSIANLGWVRQYWTYNDDNLRLTDEGLAIQEAAAFRAAGGGTIVDLTLPGVARDVDALARISLASGVHVITGCGTYVGKTHPDWVGTESEAALVERFVGETIDGIDGTGIRAGIIGEIGCSWPLEPNEAKVLRAATRTQVRTGLPISIHPGRNRASVGPILDILADAGADLRRVVISHLDRTIQDLDGLCQLAERGVYLELDCFGLETSFYPVPGIHDIVMLSDAQRLELVDGLVHAGFGSQVLLSQDICTKHRLARYGGHGYDHLVSNIVPWMRDRGVDDETIRMLLVTNPATMLAVRGPAIP